MDPGCLPRIPDLDFSIPDPWSGFFHPGVLIWIFSTLIRIRNAELTKNSRRFKSKYCYKALGNMIRDVYPGPGFFSVPAPGSRAQKNTGSRIRIRNTDYRKVVRFLSCKFTFSYQRICRKIRMFMWNFQLEVQYPVNLLLYLVRISSLYISTLLLFISSISVSLSFSLSVSRLNDVAAPLPPHAPPRTPAHPESPPPVGQTHRSESSSRMRYCPLGAFKSPHSDFLIELFTVS